MSVKEGGMLDINARRIKKTELSLTLIFYILNCLENAAFNAGEHCQSTFKRRERNKRFDFLSSHLGKVGRLTAKKEKKI